MPFHFHSYYIASFMRTDSCMYVHRKSFFPTMTAGGVSYHTYSLQRSRTYYAQKSRDN